MHDRSPMAIDSRIPTNNAATENVGLSTTRQILLGPSAKRRKAVGESHEG